MKFKGTFLFLFIMIWWLFCLPSVPNAQTVKPDPAKKKPFIPVEKKDDNAYALFKDAASVSEKTPDEAMRLYRRALQLKPDAPAERRKFAQLLEKQGKLNEAVGEYEALNSATGSAESFTDLVRVLEKAGLYNSAASVALNGAMKFPDNAGLTISTGELLLKTNRIDMALGFLKKAVQKMPDNRKILFLLGQAYEKKDMPSDALRAYLKSAGNAEQIVELKDAIKKLAARAIVIDNIRVFLPKGWIQDKNNFINIVEQQRVVIEGHVAGNINDIALNTVRGQMPAGMFSAERLKGYDETRKMAAEMAKASPDVAGQMKNVPIPVLLTKPVTDRLKGIMTLASTSEDKLPVIKSVCVFAFQSGSRIYTMSLVTSAPYQEGEKALQSLIDYIVLPL